MIHPQIRKAVLGKLKSINSGKIFWYDGRPAFLAPEELPAVAVYLTDAKATGGSIDEEEWEAAVYAENQVGLLDGNRGSDHCGLYECPRYGLAALPLHAPCLPRTTLYQLRNPSCLTLINTFQSPG